MLTQEQIAALPVLLDEAPKNWCFATTISENGQEWFGCGVMIDGYEAVWLERSAEKDISTCRLIALAPSLAATVIEQQRIIANLHKVIAENHATIRSLMDDEPNSTQKEGL